MTTDVDHQAYCSEAVAAAMGTLIGVVDKASLVDICIQTSWLSSISFAEWVSAILTQTRDWPEEHRPTPTDIHAACDYYRGKEQMERMEKDDAPVAVNAKYLAERHKHYRKPLIHGLLRVGETMNVVAAPKAGKSWLTMSLALSLSNGNPWL